MIAAVADIAVYLILLIVLLAATALYIALTFARDHSPKWSALGQTIDIGAVFDGPLRVVESWMHDIEDTLAWNGREIWDLMLETYKLFAWFAGLTPLGWINQHLAEAIAPLIHRLTGHESQISGINHTLYHSKTGLAATVAAQQSDVKYINHELQNVWTRLNELHGRVPAGVAHEVETLHLELGAVRDNITALQHQVHALSGAAALPIGLIHRDERRISGIDSRLGQLTREVAALPHAHGVAPGLSAAEQAALRDAARVWEWVKPLVAAGAVTATLAEAWRLMRNGECPCNGINLPSIGNPLTDALVADMVLKDGI